MPNEKLMQEIMEGLDRLAQQIEGENKPITNGDRIRAMTDEELAEEFEAMASYCAPGNRPSPYNCSPSGCINCWINWLKQPAKEETK